MDSLRFPALDRNISRLALGTMHLRVEDMGTASQMLDAWATLGGNLLDAAHNYGDGSTERAIGQWMRSRSNRSEVVLLTKGGHPDETGPRINPAEIRKDLEQSLERLGTDYVDIYLLHRDDISVPVGEIIDALDEHHRAGRVLTVGVSNWTTRRIEEANAYAVTHDRTRLTVSSPQLSLARQVQAPWPGCISAGDPESLRYYTAREILMLPWSSQAGGFFSENADLPERTIRAYDTPENRVRRDRAAQLAGERHASATQIALAWVLAQPFPILPIIGPLSPDELRQSVHALELQLTPGEVAWLDLRTADR